MSDELKEVCRNGDFIEAGKYYNYLNSEGDTPIYVEYVGYINNSDNIVISWVSINHKGERCHELGRTAANVSAYFFDSENKEYNKTMKALKQLHEEALKAENKRLKKTLEAIAYGNLSHFVRDEAIKHHIKLAKNALGE